MPYEIRITPVATVAIARFPAYAKSMIVDAIEKHLTHTPLLETRNRKPLKRFVTANFHFIPPLWELRIGDYRAFYDVEVGDLIVNVRAVRLKSPGSSTAEVIDERSSD